MKAHSPPSYIQRSSGDTKTEKMAKRFKLRISKAVSSSFNSCRSKEPSILPHDPVPSFFQSSTLNSTTQQHDDHHHQHSFKRHVSTALVTVGGRCSSRNGNTCTANDMSRNARSHSQELWKKEEKWHVVAKNIYDSETEVLALPPPPPPTTEKSKRQTRKKKTKTRCRISTSSADESGTFSSEAWSEIDEQEEEEDDDDETETLISSCKSLEVSTDSSSEFNQHLETIYERTRRQKILSSSKVKHTKRSISRGMNMGRRSSVSTTSSDNELLPPRLSVFKKLIPCSMDEKVKESFAIVKKSEDPYEDFKRSMMEMILEKQMFEKNDLEQLLQCFLSLNAKNYHGVIVEAFSEIWKTLFLPNDHPSDSAYAISTHLHRRTICRTF